MHSLLPRAARQRLGAGVRHLLFPAACFLLLIVTLPPYGVTFDEPPYMQQAWDVLEWLSLPAAEMLDAARIDAAWKRDPLHNVHPSGLKWLYLGAQALVFWEADPYARNRWLTILLIVTASWIFARWAFPENRPTSMLAMVLLLLLPRFFAHCHFASADIPLTALVLLVAVSLDRFLGRRHFWLCGLALGLLASMKFMGLLMAAPLVVIALLCAGTAWRSTLARLAGAVLIAGTVFLLLNPDWWFAPGSRAVEFFTTTLRRREWTPFTVFFAGEAYTYRGPFYSPLVILLITTPLFHLAAWAGGAWQLWHKRLPALSPRWWILVAGAVTPVIIMALPMSPTNDLERYLLPAFPFASCIAALGLTQLWDWLRRAFATPGMGRTKALAGILGAAMLVLGALNVRDSIGYHPWELSYFNEVIGGVRGAETHGFEVSYWLEMLNDDTLRELNQRCYGSRVYFPIPPNANFFRHMLLFRKLDFIPCLTLEHADFVLLYARPSVPFWQEALRPALRQAGKQGIPVWSLELKGVPLLQLERLDRILAE